MIQWFHPYLSGSLQELLLAFLATACQTWQTLVDSCLAWSQDQREQTEAAQWAKGWTVRKTHAGPGACLNHMPLHPNLPLKVTTLVDFITYTLRVDCIMGSPSISTLLEDSPDTSREPGVAYNLDGGSGHSHICPAVFLGYCSLIISSTGGENCNTGRAA